MYSNAFGIFRFSNKTLFFDSYNIKFGEDFLRSSINLSSVCPCNIWLGIKNLVQEGFFKRYGYEMSDVKT